VLVLGVETSCDETGVALVRDGLLVAEALASQTDIHAVFGGVVPEIASREHQRMLPVLFRDLLGRVGATPQDINAIAVARGPGLLGSLLVGLSFAKGLCLATNATLIGVNHLHAHLLAAGLEQEMHFPALGLLVSGGHTHIYRIDSPTAFSLLGRTLDDAAGEAFDKVAKLLNLPYPGGRYLDDLSQGVEPDHKLFPLAYTHNDNLDFSFSGLKTSVAEHLGKRPHLSYCVMPDADALQKAAPWPWPDTLRSWPWWPRPSTTPWPRPCASKWSARWSGRPGLFPLWWRAAWPPTHTCARPWPMWRTGMAWPCIFPVRRCAPTTPP